MNMNMNMNMNVNGIGSSSIERRKERLIEKRRYGRRRSTNGMIMTIRMKTRITTISLLLVVLILLPSKAGASTGFPGTLPNSYQQQRKNRNKALHTSSKSAREEGPTDLDNGGSGGGASSSDDDDDDEEEIDSSSDFDDADLSDTASSTTLSSVITNAHPPPAAAAAAPHPDAHPPSIVKTPILSNDIAAIIDADADEEDEDDDNDDDDDENYSAESEVEDDHHQKERLQQQQQQQQSETEQQQQQQQQQQQRPHYSPTTPDTDIIDTDHLDGTPPPLQTLKKLQKMLDKTDYLTSSPNAARRDSSSTDAAAAKRVHVIQSHQRPTYYSQQQQQQQQPTKIIQKDPPDEPDKLWTSRDRQKYKKMQQMQRRAKEERRRLQRELNAPPIINQNSSDDEITDTDTDDGLGYTLPNLPVYVSDTEGETDHDAFPATTTNRHTPTPFDQQSYRYHQQQQQQQQRHPLPQQQQQQQQYMYPPGPYGMPPPPPDSQIPPYMGYPPMPYPPYASYNPQQLAAQYAAAWASYHGRSYPPTHPHHPTTNSMVQRNPPPHTGTAPRQRLFASGMPYQNDGGQSLVTTAAATAATATTTPPSQESSTSPQPQFPTMPLDEVMQGPFAETQLAVPLETHMSLNFDSLQKLSILLTVVSLLSFCAVSPRTLPTALYNERFRRNLALLALPLIAPMIEYSLVLDARENDVNNLVTAFYASFTVGYTVSFMLEIILTTVIRLGVFALWEPSIFNLTPKVPSLVLPWVLREQKYRPKRITLFAADFFTSCIASPIVEEYMKLKILQLTARLPRNYRWTAKKSSKSNRKKLVAEPVARAPGESDVSNINRYVTSMLAVSLGIKLCDGARRILMYTKPEHKNKAFYALCRGIFPIHELCGTMTALALAQRDVLGVNMPLWKMLSLPVFIHGMANFRGMKPIFKWNSATPWSEMQLSPLDMSDPSNMSQLIAKLFPKVMWLIILGRVLGYCVKNYYLIGRQAKKRISTYFGKRSAFSAELAAAEMLKKSKKGDK